MSKLNDLLQGIDAEFKLLGNVSKIFSGGTPNTAKLEYYDGDIPWIRSGEVNFNVITSSARNITKDGLLGSSAKLIRKNSVVLAMTGATVGRSAVIEFETSSNQSVAAIETDESIIFYKYLYYFLENSYLEIKNAGQGALTSLNLAMIKKFKIPIPCPDNPEKSLKMQQEIVRILDEFTSLTDQLKNELETERQNRKKQFEFFRTAYLNNQENEIQWLKLSKLGKFTYGLAASASDFGNTRFVRISDINAKGKLIKEDIKYVDLSDENKKYLLKKNDLLMARTGATFGKTMIFDEDYDAIYAGFLIKLDLDNNIILPKYYWHFAQSILFWEQANKLVNGGGQPQFNANTLKNVQVPIPFFNNSEKSLEEQERIVKILDQFDATHSAIEQELTKEIKLRTQQYEYYREKLLTFSKN